MPMRKADGGTSDLPYEMVGYRNRMSYRANKDTLIRRLLAPGIPSRVMTEIRQTQIDRSLGRQNDANRQRGFDRLFTAIREGETDVIDEIMDAHRYRPQDIKRQWELSQHPGWIRKMSGTTESKINRIYKRWEKGVTPYEEIIEALTVHVSDFDQNAPTLNKIGQIIRNKR